jgi:hypothetical protein
MRWKGGARTQPLRAALQAANRSHR